MLMLFEKRLQMYAKIGKFARKFCIMAPIESAASRQAHSRLVKLSMSLFRQIDLSPTPQGRTMRSKAAMHRLRWSQYREGFVNGVVICNT
jgi:hypothetical protein